MMVANDKLVKQIIEAKYLTVENTNRYRPIIRYFFLQYEKLEYWLYKEDIFLQMKTLVSDYSVELCEQDLERLVEWKTLTKIQDTSNVTTVEEFKNRKFRYQLSEYAVEIERLVIRLENLHVTSSSLEPKLFEKIEINLSQLLVEQNKKNISFLWQELMDDFKTLNENYQDFLKKFHEAKTEEMMKTAQFLLFKDEMIQYLREFIKGFQKYDQRIKAVIQQYDQPKIMEMMNAMIDYQKSIPKIEPEFDYDYLKQINQDKWNSISRWFISSDYKISESARLIMATNNIINRITKYVNSIIEVYGQSNNRSSEYLHICKLFGNAENMTEVKKLSVAVFGVSQVHHFIGLEKETDDINISVYDTDTRTVELKSRTHKIRNRVHKVPIIDKTFEKEKQREEYLKLLEREKKLLSKYISQGKIRLSELDTIHTFERRFILGLITKGLRTSHKVIENKEYEIKYTIHKIDENYVMVHSEDGDLEIPNYEITFMED